jgi:hypothetical protein
MELKNGIYISFCEFVLLFIMVEVFIIETPAVGVIEENPHAVLVFARSSFAKGYIRSFRFFCKLDNSRWP